MRKWLFLLLLAASTTAFAQKEDVVVETGTFENNWTSLGAWECPEWFKDAKFGIWAHWGPQCHAEDGDWYARFMYYNGSGQNEWHKSHFGDPATFGLKDLCNDWKAQNWDPERLINLYKSVGARYFMTLGNHHDNFDLWDSPYQEWNSVNVGPKKDLVKGWSDACKAAGLPLGVSIHASHAWTWLEPSQEYDGNLTKEDGVGKWWEGMDPQELYAQKHTHSSAWENSGTIHSQWEWGNGASQPSAAYKQKFQNRVLQLVNDYNPDMIYFDDTAMPFYGCDDQIGKNILQHYYNHSAAQHGGTPQVVVTGKQLNVAQKRYMMWDVERGIPDRIQNEYWQTCTCIGSWHYDIHVYQNNGYKSAQQVVDMLVDIVSKNGNMLLSVPVRSDGTIDDKEEKVLAGIKAWMDINSKSIYGTRPWKTFGEGPLADAANPLSAQGFNEGNNYSSKDVRYVQRNDTLFATIMRWPSGNTFTFQCLGKSSEYYSGKVKSLRLLGYGDVEYTETVTGLTVTLPDVHPNEIAPVFEITFVEGSDNTATLQEVIKGYEELLATLRPLASNNTGKLSKRGIEAFSQAIEEAKKYLNDSEANQKVAIAQLNDAYQELLKNGRNQPGAPSEGYEKDITTEQLIEASNFSATEMGSRFGKPTNWTVENYSVPQNDSSKGVKNGIDRYPGYNTLFLGVWGSEDRQPYTCDLANSRIYRTVHLKQGSYYFGQKLESSYNLSERAYIFAANQVMPTVQVEDESIAFAHINGAQNGKWYGINFYLPEEQDVVLGFEADLTGAENGEFRVQEIKLLSYGMVNADALFDLIERAWLTLTEVKINGNTGFYKREAADVLEAAILKAEEAAENENEDEIDQAYEALQQAVNDFLQNGKNVGGAPIGTNYEDKTIEVFGEAENFERTEETNNGARFGAPKKWTVENFGFGEQAGIDGYPGYDCLAIEVWWNNTAYADNGYDIHNARIYQQAKLPAGRYYLGACYPGYEPNSDSYIFVSEKILATNYIPSQSVAYEKVELAPRDASSFRGVFFTLEKPTTVYMGFQADFSESSTANIRVKAIKLLYYGEITHDKLQSLIGNVEEQLNDVIINDNTGYYSQQAYDNLLAIINEAKAVESTAEYDEVSNAYNSLSEALANFLQNGRNPGGQPDKMGAADLTIDKLHEGSNFARMDETVTTRFAAPQYWTVDNFYIQKGGEGIKQGLDKYPGYDCLSLGLWDDRDHNETGDLTDARIYQTVALDAGRYYFGNTFDTRYNLHQAYLFAAAQTLPTADIETRSIAWLDLNKRDADNNHFDGIYFTISQPMDVYLGFQANLAEGSGQQEFRANKVVLYGYNVESGIETMTVVEDSNAPRQYYTLTGVRLQQPPQHGFYIVRQGGKTQKRWR